MPHSTLFRVVSMLALTAITACPALAVEGVLEINQARAAVGSVTPGDTPGFPITISVAGNYRLSSDLDLSGEVEPQNTNAIHVTTSGVTIDLGGFTIRGITVCTIEPTVCSNTGSGIGVFVDVPENGLTIRNGSIQGMGHNGIYAPFDSRLENMRLVSNGALGADVSIGRSLVFDTQALRNGGTGINTGSGSVVRSVVAGDNAGAGVGGGSGSTIDRVAAYRNGGDGIATGGASVITNSSARENLGDGIRTQGTSNLRGNTSVNNGGFGIRVTGIVEAAYAGNVIRGNTGGTVSGLFVEIGENLCEGNTTCP